MMRCELEGLVKSSAFIPVFFSEEVKNKPKNIPIDTQFQLWLKFSDRIFPEVSLSHRLRSESAYLTQVRVGMGWGGGEYRCGQKTLNS